MCPEGSGDKVAMDGQGSPCWEMVVEWLLWRLHKQEPLEVGLRMYPSEFTSPLSVAGSAGRGRREGLKTGSLVEICEQHTLTPFFPICTGEQKFIYSLGKLSPDLGSPT